MCMCVWQLVATICTRCQCPKRPEEDTESLRTGVAESDELPSEYCEASLSSMQEQKVLSLTAEPSSQPYSADGL